MKIFKIKEICHLEKGKQIDTTLLSNGNPYKYINGGIKESGYYTTYNTEGEAVLVSEGGASCGYVNYINEKFWCGCHCYKLTKCKFLPKYIYYALKGNQEKLMALRTGAAMPNIKKTTFQDMELCLNENPAEQEMVIKELDKIQIALDIKKTELIALDDLVKSRFIEMFVEKGFKEITFSDYAEIIDGDRGKNYPKAEEFSDEGYCLFLSAKNVTKDGFLFEQMQFISEEKDNLLRKGKLCRGDIVITTRGTIGNIAFYDDDIPYDNVRINSGMVIIRQKEVSFNQIFFLNAFKNKIDEIKETNVTGAAQPQLPIHIMSKIKLLNPPIELQNEFADFVKLIDKSKFIVQKQIDDLQELLDSKMDEYFG